MTTLWPRSSLLSLLAIVSLTRCAPLTGTSQDSARSSNSNVGNSTMSPERAEAIKNCDTRHIPGVSPRSDACLKEHFPFVIENRDTCMKKVRGSVPQKADEWRAWGCDPANQMEYVKVLGCTIDYYANYAATGKFSPDRVQALLNCWHNGKQMKMGEAETTTKPINQQN